MHCIHFPSKTFFYRLFYVMHDNKIAYACHYFLCKFHECNNFLSECEIYHILPLQTYPC